MADAAVEFLTEQLKTSIRRNTNLISGAKDELERLNDDLRLLEAFLHDTDRNPDLERWIKELVYHVQDITESWLILRGRTKNNIWGGFVINIIGVYGLARKIAAVREGKLDPTFRRIKAYQDLQLIPQQQHPSKVNQVPTVRLNIDDEPMIVSKKFVGLEDEAETLIRSLLAETKELDVIAITGMPGIGKTALAWKIYQNNTIRTEFRTRIWVDIPVVDFCSMDLYLIMLKELFKQGIASYDDLVPWLDMPEESACCGQEIEVLYEFTASGRISDHQLTCALHACLKQSRFLLVLDDVWTGETLENMRHFLPNTGKVLITSRSNSFCSKHHVLRFLNEKESWELLQFEVFGKLGECPEILKSTGECIAKNCDGSPLAISVVASSLMAPSTTDAPNDLTETWWKKVSKNVTTYITEYGAQHKVFECVELSYIRLPQDLQHCFLYLGMFPEGDEIPVWRLIRLWIAEGLIQDYRQMPLEESAKQNLYHLVSVNLVVVGKKYPNGLIKTCHLHKVIYGFCKTKAAKEEFHHEIKMSRGALDSPMSLTLNHRRLCIDSSCLSEFLSSQPEGPCVRTILCLDKEAKVLHPKYSSTIHKPFKLLKIFECRGIKLTKFPRTLSKLLNLRYISLSVDDLDFIPEDISSLCYLETLVVDTQSPSLRLKANIWKMLRLQNLVTKAAIVIVTRGKGEAGKDLHTLTRLAPVSCTEDVFRRTPNLKTLGIRGCLAALSDANALRNLMHLEDLKLIYEPAAGSGQLHRLIDPNCFAPNLKKLTLSATCLEWECMSILGKIDSLEILKLKNNAFTGGSWNVAEADGFRGLVFLLIGSSDLVSWEASPHCFPSLKCLVLKNCEKLEKIPLTLAKSLDTLDVESVSESAKESAREIEQEIKRRQGQSSRWIISSSSE